MNIHFYSEEDLRNDTTVSIDGKSYPVSFIADVPGDNADILSDYDNHVLADRLERFGAVGKNDRLDCESCCFYIYFRTKQEGVDFIARLNQYIGRKAKLIQEATAF